MHELARDFDLLDVWEFDIRGTAHAPRNFAAFEETFAKTVADAAEGSGIAPFLFRLRSRMGKWFGWDGPNPGFDVVYRHERESLRKIENRTVHAMLHLGWVHKDGNDYAPRLAVYVKPRGLLGRAYLALINPFRHLFVYPTLLRNVASAWHARA